MIDNNFAIIALKQNPRKIPINTLAIIINFSIFFSFHHLICYYYAYIFDKTKKAFKAF